MGEKEGLGNPPTVGSVIMVLRTTDDAGVILTFMHWLDV